MEVDDLQCNYYGLHVDTLSKSHSQIRFWLRVVFCLSAIPFLLNQFRNSALVSLLLFVGSIPLDSVYSAFEPFQIFFLLFGFRLFSHFDRFNFMGATLRTRDLFLYCFVLPFLELGVFGSVSRAVLGDFVGLLYFANVCFHVFIIASALRIADGAGHRHLLFQVPFVATPLLATILTQAMTSFADAYRSSMVGDLLLSGSHVLSFVFLSVLSGLYEGRSGEWRPLPS
jgi:hypothetical protein